MSSLYERLGGEGAVNAAVELFYRKVLADGRIAHFFDDVDMESQIAKQKAFLTMAFGGPNNYTGADMRNAHKRLVDKRSERFACRRGDRKPQLHAARSWRSRNGGEGSRRSRQFRA